MFKMSNRAFFNLGYKQVSYLVAVIWTIVSILSLVLYLEKFGYDEGFGEDRNMKHIFVCVSFINIAVSVALFFGLSYESSWLVGIWLGVEVYCLIIYTIFFTVLGMFRNMDFALNLIPIGFCYFLWFVLHCCHKKIKEYNLLRRRQELFESNHSTVHIDDLYTPY